MSASGRAAGHRALVLVLALAVAAPSAALAAPPAVTWAFPVAPIVGGSNAVELAFDVEGQAARLEVSATGRGAGGDFAALAGAIVERDYASAYPFHLRLALSAPFPASGALELTAVAIASDGSRGPATTHRIVSGASAPGFVGERPITVRRDATGGVLLEVAFAGQVVQGEATLLGVSSQALRAANGNLAQLGSAVPFADERLLVARPRTAAPGRITFSVPTRTTAPIDGVVIADVALLDPFGRKVHASAVEFTRKPREERSRRISRTSSRRFASPSNL